MTAFRSTKGANRASCNLNSMCKALGSPSCPDSTQFLWNE
jgi:hypothetical protein